jgi:hypothetical protein
LVLSLFFYLVLFPAFSHLAADPVSSTSYTETDISSSKAVAVAPNLNRLYLGVDTNSGDNLYVYSLNDQGNVDTSVLPLSYNYGDNTRSLALDTQLQRLYMANHAGTNELYILTLDNIGDVVGNVPCDFFTSGAKALALDTQRGCLYVALNHNSDGLGVVKINADPASALPVFFTGATVYSLALDAARNKLYMGCGDGQIRVYDLNAAGIPETLDGTSYPAAVGSNPVLSLALDSVRNRLHACLSGKNNIYTFTLGSGGKPLGPGVASDDMGSPILCLNLDATSLYATQNRMYMGRSSGGSGDLGWVGMDSNDGDILSGPTWMSLPDDADTIWSIALDAQRQRIYTAATQDCCYYTLDDPPMTSFWIDDGGETTSDTRRLIHGFPRMPAVGEIKGTRIAPIP